MIILIGEIDLSVGSIIAVSGCLSAGLITNNGIPTIAAVLIAIVAGTMVGAFNGLVVSMTKIPSFIVTLAVMNIGRGFARIYTKSTTILVDDDLFAAIGTGKIFAGIPIHIIYIIVVILISAFILNRTKFGRHIYAVGDNELYGVFNIWIFSILCRNFKCQPYVFRAVFCRGRDRDGCDFSSSARGNKYDWRCRTA